MRNLTIAILIIAAGCKRTASDNDVPPPIAHGTCLVDRYEGSAALQQTCTHVGYLWGCKREEKAGRFVLTCARGEEARGERPLAKPPIPPPPTQATGSAPAAP